jgi:2-C-methyl-D-erythritol 4-phosphate cytidylyltransferase
MNVALIFAGGIGSRMGMEVPKQYIEIEGKPILIRTLELFENNTNIDKIFLVVASDWRKHAEDLVDKYHIRKLKGVVIGGGSALESIHNGLKHMYADGVDVNDIVLIHDGVRPIIDDDVINHGIEMAEVFGNSICSCQVAETIAVVEDGTVSSITDRSNTRTLQAPQSFRFGDISEVYQRAKEENLLDRCVDSAQVSLIYGIKLHCFNGGRDNIKLTTARDLAYFQYLLRGRTE